MEDNRASFTLNTTGSTSGNPYNGDFEVKTLLSRRDHMNSDQRRREVIGPSPDGTSPAPTLQAEAYMIGQLAVRITKAPDWWANSDGGLDLPDENVVPELFALAIAKEKDRQNKLVAKAETAKGKLKKTPVEE